jgi:hypothetical protein
MKYSKSKIIIVLLTALYFVNAIINGANWHIIDSVNLIFHEAGHTIFFFMPEFVMIAAGSFFQIFIPFLCCAYFFYKKEYFSTSIVMFWLGQNFVNVSVYAGDAINMQLSLLGGDSVIHDWNYLLINAGLINYTDFISKGLLTVGFIIIAGGFVLGLKYAISE